MTENEIQVAMEPELDYLGEILEGAPPMSKTVDQLIAEKTAEISADEAALLQKKEMVNMLCKADGRSPIFAIQDVTAVPTRIRSDQFYGQPLASSVRTILEMRKQQDLGAATVNEIFDSLIAGGYEFDTKSDDIARKSLRNSLSKNNILFHKLPNGRFGMLAWYPNAKKAKVSPSSLTEQYEEAETEDATLALEYKGDGA